MKWRTDYTDRLRAWADLRDRAHDLPIEQSLVLINNWWFATPWRPYLLHWDDWRSWPDPWQLLEENDFCDLARALGILYTIHLADIAATVTLAQCSDRHLVLVDDGLYVLNWEPDTLINIASQKITITKTLSSVDLPQLMS